MTTKRLFKPVTLPTGLVLDRVGKHLLEKALTRIKRHPKSLDMADFVGQGSCGTVACLAGHVILAAGCRVDVTRQVILAAPARYHDRCKAGSYVCADSAERLLGLKNNELRPVFLLDIPSADKWGRTTW